MLTTASRRSLLRPTMATLHPFVSNAKAQAFPMPAEPPAWHAPLIVTLNLRAGKPPK